VAAGREESRKASFRSENSAVARGVVLQKICCLPSSKPELWFVSVLKHLSAGHSDCPQKMIYGVRRGGTKKQNLNKVGAGWHFSSKASSLHIIIIIIIIIINCNCVVTRWQWLFYM